MSAAKENLVLARSVAERMMRALDQASDRLEHGDGSGYAPVAIIGMACRFPGGADSPDRFYDLLKSGRDAICELPADRRTGDRSVPRGGYLHSIRDFDADFFGISGREAICLDPQQRFLLELTWEALERAAIAPNQLRGSRTGVFIGVTASDYSRVLEDSLNAEEMGGYLVTGNALNFCAGRIAWKFGLEGPALAVDTACSSSLAAIHLACRSLHSGESTLALAGGVNLTSWPAATESLVRAGMLAPDGTCRTFSADAKGYGRGEGCAVLLLERLTDAMRNHRNILAVIRGSGMNQDGASSGLTVPNGRAQQAVMRAALKAARIAPGEVDYLECHGTGTPLGDPIEVHAAAAVYGEGRTRPLVIGAVKTNVGHLEAAAGIASVCKAVLALKHAEIPAHLHFAKPNPHIAWAELPVRVATTREQWSSSGKPRRAAVSSFGASGTNVHLVLEEAPPRAEADGSHNRIQPGECLLVLSAQSEVALQNLAARYRELLESSPDSDLAPICRSAALTRAHMKHRLAVTGNIRTMVEKLRNGNSASSERPNELEQLAERYRAGEEIDWREHYDDSNQCAVELPVYPFDRRSFWPASRKADASIQELRAQFEAQADEIARAAGVDRAAAIRVFDELEKRTRKSPGGDHWYYRLTWRPRPVWSARGALFASTAETLQSAATECMRRFDAPRVREYEDLIAHLERAAAAYFRAAVRAADGLPAGERRRLYERAKEIAATASDEASAETMLAEIRKRYPGAAIETALLSRCGAALGDAFAGRVNDNEVLFPTSGVPTAEDLYHRSLGAEVANFALAAAVKAACAGIPDWRRLRVLEIGAGTGSATQAVLDGLPRDRVEYVFSDVSAGFFGRAKSRFAAHEFIRYRTFDVQRPGMEQGFDPGTFDLVIASNVLHATRDVELALGHVRELMAPSGMLLLLENIVPSPFLDAIFGLTDGWWGFADERRRRNHPLLSRERWTDALERCGFIDTGALMPQEAGSLFARQTVVAARRGEDLPPQRRIVFAGPRQALGEVEAPSTVVCAGPEFRWIGKRRLELDPLQPEHLRRLFEAVPTDDIVYLQEFLETESPAVDALKSSSALLHIVQHAGKARLFVVTRGAQAVDGSGAPSFAHGSLWGFCASLRLEKRDWRCVCIDLDPAAESGSAARILAAELLTGDREQMIAYRGMQRFAGRLSVVDGSDSAMPTFQADGTWLISGGLRGIGFLTAKWLAGRGAKNFALLGRKPPSLEEQEEISALRAIGVRVETLCADVADEGQLKEAIDRIRRTMAPLTGIVHSAGVLADRMIEGQTAASFAEVFAAKVTGAWNLHRLTLQDPLTHFVLYSTGISLIGSPGQSNHAAANAFLNALAEHRSLMGLPGLSLAWGRWSDIGSAAKQSIGEYSRKRGFSSISPERGRQALDELFWRRGTFAVMAADWRVVASQFPEGDAALLSELTEAEAVPANHRKGQSSAAIAAEILAGDAEAGKRPLVEEYLRECIRQILGLDALPSTATPLTEMGLDSLVSTELRNRLLYELKIDLPMKTLLSGVSIDQLAATILERLLLSSLLHEDSAEESVEEYLI